jgi:D-3-phosphoglycerate dehydrogenase
LFGAGIDVFETEPPSADNPLLSAPNTVISDHTAWYSEFSIRELQTKAAEEAARVLKGEAPLHWVNPW